MEVILKNPGRIETVLNIKKYQVEIKTKDGTKPLHTPPRPLQDLYLLAEPPLARGHVTFFMYMYANTYSRLERIIGVVRDGYS